MSSAAELKDLFSDEPALDQDFADEELLAYHQRRSAAAAKGRRRLLLAIASGLVVLCLAAWALFVFTHPPLCHHAQHPVATQSRTQLNHEHQKLQKQHMPPELCNTIAQSLPPHLEPRLQPTTSQQPQKRQLIQGLHNTIAWDLPPYEPIHPSYTPTLTLTPTPTTQQLQERQPPDAIMPIPPLGLIPSDSTPKPARPMSQQPQKRQPPDAIMPIPPLGLMPSDSTSKPARPMASQQLQERQPRDAILPTAVVVGFVPAHSMSKTARPTMSKQPQKRQQISADVIEATLAPNHADVPPMTYTSLPLVPSVGTLPLPTLMPRGQDIKPNPHPFSHCPSCPKANPPLNERGPKKSLGPLGQCPDYPSPMHCPPLNERGAKPPKSPAFGYCPTCPGGFRLPSDPPVSDPPVSDPPVST